MHHGVTFFALPKCVHLPYLRYLSLMTKINGLDISPCCGVWASLMLFFILK